MRPEQRIARWHLIAPEVVAKLADEDLRGCLTKPISVVPLYGAACQKVMGGEFVYEKKKRKRTHVHVLARQILDELVMAIGLDGLLPLRLFRVLVVMRG
jgi:hypothetical protein